MALLLLLRRGATFTVRFNSHRSTARFLSSIVVQQQSHEPPSPSLQGSNRSQSNAFEVTAPYEPAGDQPQAIQQLVRQLEEGDKFSILRGITGTGKTFVMSHVIAKWGRPTLVLCHNKTLAAQLARELRGFLSNNAVELFVSYYDHYVPESFIETSGTYIAKKSSVNDEIDALRHRATRALLERRDVVVVASVSCIYGLGLPAEYLQASFSLQVDDEVNMQELIAKLENMLYTRPDDDMLRGNYQLSSTLDDQNRSNGCPQTHVLSLWPPHERFPIRIELVGTPSLSNTFCVKSIHGHDVLGSLTIFPAKHHVISEDQLEEACLRIEDELEGRVQELTSCGKHVEAQRLQQRVLTDLLMLRETGFCSGGENYSRHFAGRAAGEPPDTLMDYLGLSGNGDWLLVVDESHVTLPQLKAMYGGDQARKRSLVKHGYRLPSALDNRPLRHDEFWDQISQAVFASATPGKQEVEWTKRDPVDMIIRPTFVCDPLIHVRPPKGQLDDLLKEVKTRAERSERTLAVALTKRDAEDLAEYLKEHGVSSTYIHSGLTTHERSDALKALQSGEIDCLVGVNLLREGLDLPQVSLVAILNADSEGFLRSETALLQTVGRAARNINGTALFYANRVTESMQRCMDDTKHRQERQLAYNSEWGYESRSTEGSSMMSIFDLLKDEIDEERKVEIMPRADSTLNQMDLLLTSSSVVPMTQGSSQNTTVPTEHLPGKPGVYFWKDSDGRVLYIGKAKKLRSRVRSYLSPGAKHSPRIKVMLEKARTVDFVLTPSERDALLLESNLIKHHQPPYNVLLKDDEAYPYICASVGDPFPRFFVAPRRQIGEKAERYRYFGPYTHFNEINKVLLGIEEQYDLRAKSFAARHGDGCKTEYRELFHKVLAETFDSSSSHSSPEASLPRMRSEFEEGSLLFDNKENACRDVVAIGRRNEDGNAVTVHVLQLREGLIAGRFSYDCEVPAGLESDEDLPGVVQTVLERQHYPSGETSPGRFSFFPDEILSQFPLPDATELKRAVRLALKQVESTRRSKLTVRTPVSRGPRKETDARAMMLAVENAEQVALDRRLERVPGATRTSVDGSAEKELASLFSLEQAKRIECYDISHTQGDGAVGSRVVFIDGKPQNDLYRKFNIKTVDGIDDYASLQEVLERRFRHAWVNGKGGIVDEDSPWSIPDLVVIDGGVGQLNAAVKGMSKAGVFPKSHHCVVSKQVGMRGEEQLDDGVIVEEEVMGNRSALGRQTFVAVCALAKNEEQVFVHGKNEPVNDSRDSPGLLLLRSLRDESHRFALNAHRKRRSVRRNSAV